MWLRKNGAAVRFILSEPISVRKTEKPLLPNAVHSVLLPLAHLQNRQKPPSVVGEKVLEMVGSKTWQSQIETAVRPIIIRVEERRLPPVPASLAYSASVPKAKAAAEKSTNIQAEVSQSVNG